MRRLPRRRVVESVFASCAEVWNAHPSLRRQGGADDLLVIARIDALVCEGRVRPDNGAARVAVDGVNEVRPAEFVVFFGGELGYDQVALFAEEKAALGLFHNKGVAPA